MRLESDLIRIARALDATVQRLEFIRATGDPDYREEIAFHRAQVRELAAILDLSPSEAINMVTRPVDM